MRYILKVIHKACIAVQEIFYSIFDKGYEEPYIREARKKELSKLKIMNVEVKADVKHTRKVLDKDKYFMIKIKVSNKNNKLVAEAEVGFINETLDLEKFKKQFKDVLDKNHKLKILSNIEFKNKKEYDAYKSKIQ